MGRLRRKQETAASLCVRRCSCNNERGRHYKFGDFGEKAAALFKAAPHQAVSQLNHSRPNWSASQISLFARKKKSSTWHIVLLKIGRTIQTIRIHQSRDSSLYWLMLNNISGYSDESMQNDPLENLPNIQMTLRGRRRASKQ